MLASVCGRIGEVLRFGCCALRKRGMSVPCACTYVPYYLLIMHATLEGGKEEGRRGCAAVGVGRIGCVGLTGNNQGNRRAGRDNLGCFGNVHGETGSFITAAHANLPVSLRVARHWASVL